MPKKTKENDLKLMTMAAAVLVLMPAMAKADVDGKELFTRTCATCHFAKRDPARMADMVAPPMDMLSAHVRVTTGGDRDAFIKQVVDYIKAPSPEKSVEPIAIQRFGLMPAIGESFPDLKHEDLVAIAGWIYDEYKNVTLPSPEQQRKLIEQTRGR